MPISRRNLLAGSALAAFAAPLSARAQESRGAPQGIDATRYGVRANAEAEQTRALQKAIDEATRAGQPLWLAPGQYRSGPLTLPAAKFVRETMGLSGIQTDTLEQFGDSIATSGHGRS